VLGAGGDFFVVVAGRISLSMSCARSRGTKGATMRTAVLRMTVMREKIQRLAIVPPVRDPEASVQLPCQEAGRAEPKNPNHRMLMIGLMGMTLYHNKMPLSPASVSTTVFLALRLR